MPGMLQVLSSSGSRNAQGTEYFWFQECSRYWVLLVPGMLQVLSSSGARNAPGTEYFWCQECSRYWVLLDILLLYWNLIPRVSCIHYCKYKKIKFKSLYSTLTWGQRDQEQAQPKPRQCEQHNLFESSPQCIYNTGLHWSRNLKNIKILLYDGNYTLFWIMLKY